MKKLVAWCLVACFSLSTAIIANAALPSSLQGGGIGQLNGGVQIAGKKVITTFANGNNFGMWPDASKTYFVSDQSQDSDGSGAVMIKSGGTLTSNASDNQWNTWTDAASGAISVDGSYFLSLWVKPTTATNLLNGSSAPFINLSSTNDNADNTAFAYWFKANYVLPANQWTNLLLPLTAGNIANYVEVAKSGADIDLTALKFLRIMNNNADMLVDNITLQKMTATEADDWSISLPGGKTVLFDDCNGAKGMVLHHTPVGGSYAGYPMTGFVNANATDGAGSYFASGSGSITMQQIWGTGFDALVLANSRNQYVAFDLYLSDVSAISTDTEKAPWYGGVAAQMSYSAGDAWNDDGMNWLLDPSKLHNGWNRVVLPFNYTQEALVDLGYATVERKANGPVDANGNFALNQFRVCFDTTSTGSLDVYVDNVQVIYSEGVPATQLDTQPTASKISGTSITLTWPKAQDTAGGTVGGYVVTREVNDAFMEEWVADGDAILVDGADTLSAVINGLEPQTQYRFTVKAVSDIHESPLNILSIYKTSEIITTTEDADDDDNNSGGSDKDDDDSNPETGGTAATGAVVLMITAAGVLAVTRKKKS